jgi:hypothetical protein
MLQGQALKHMLTSSLGFHTSSLGFHIGSLDSHAQAYTLNTTHSGGRVLRFDDLNHSNPSCALMFIRNPHNRQTAKAPSSS